MTAKPEDYEPPKMTDANVSQLLDEVQRRWHFWTHEQRREFANAISERAIARWEADNA